MSNLFWFWLFCLQNTDILKHELHFIDFLFRMVMTAVPAFIINPFFDSVEPLFCALIHGTLVNPRKKNFRWFIF